MLKEILTELTKIDDILFVVKNDCAVSEIRSNSLNLHQKDKWITVGDNDGPCHMHINQENIKNIKFVTEQKPERTSFSVRFFDNSGERVLAAFFTKMYDESKNLDHKRKQLYDELLAKYGSDITLTYRID